MAAKRLPSEERSAQIASIAARLFAKKGFNGVTTREIAKAAGVSEAILYRHFPTKDALYKAIINQKITAKPEHFDFEAAKAEDDAEVFRSAARYFLDEVEKDNTFLRLMLYSALEDHDLAGIFLRERTDVLFDFLLNYIEKRSAQGAFKKMKPAIALRSFVGVFFHFMLVHELYKIPADLEISKEEAIKSFVDIFLNGIRKQ